LLVEEIENWNIMRTDKVIKLLRQSSRCDSEGLLARYAITRNHGATACVGTQKQHLSGRWRTTSARIDRSKV
jgi:hypothetical protein